MRLADYHIHRSEDKAIGILGIDGIFKSLGKRKDRQVVKHLPWFEICTLASADPQVLNFFYKDGFGEQSFDIDAYIESLCAKKDIELVSEYFYKYRVSQLDPKSTLFDRKVSSNKKAANEK